jgi:hypothetical protein
VRDRLGAGESAAGLVPRAVLDYIYARGLYRAAKPSDTPASKPAQKEHKEPQ